MEISKMIDLSSIPEIFWWLLGAGLFIVAIALASYLYAMGENERAKHGLI